MLEDGASGSRARTSSVGEVFAPGTTVAERFRIDRVLGIGGMGNVYAASDLTTGHQVALKVLKKASALTDEAGERFRREAEILKAARHPGIVGIHGFGQASDGTAWLAMELLVGETLRERVTREGPMRPEALAPILASASDALTEAHARGVVHRDLKPDHLFLPANGAPAVKVLDFGLSRAIGDKKLTRTGTVLGTPRYMSPEQIASAHASDGQSDVYALGVIIYEALTGKSPFVASDHGQLLGAILQGRIEPLERLRPDLPAALGDVLSRAMAKDRAQRYRTPSEFAGAFFGAVTSHATMADARSTVAERPRFASDHAIATQFRERMTAPPPPTRYRPPWWVVLLAITACLGLGALGAFAAHTLIR